MTTRLSKTPSVGTFTDAWSKRFSEVVTEAAGKDGRLSAKEAARIAERPDDGFAYADNAVNYLEAKDQSSVSASKLIASGRAYAEAVARLAAGPDGRLSLADQQKLPEDLRLDVAMLQGRSGPKPAQPTDFKSQLTTLTDGMQNWSESESPVVPLSAGPIAGKPISAELVAQRFQGDFAQHKDALAGGSRFVDDQPLAQQPVTAGSAEDFLTHHATVHDVGDPMAVAYAGRWQALGDALRANLTDMQVFRFGTVEPTYVLVGKTASGELAGFLTGAVET